MERKSRLVVGQCLEEGEMRVDGLTSWGFPLRSENPGPRQRRWLHNIRKVVNATELLALKQLEWWILCHAHFAVIKMERYTLCWEQTERPTQSVSSMRASWGQRLSWEQLTVNLLNGLRKRTRSLCGDEAGESGFCAEETACSRSPSPTLHQRIFCYGYYSVMPVEKWERNWEAFTVLQLRENFWSIFILIKKYLHVHIVICIDFNI